MSNPYQIESCMKKLRQVSIVAARDFNALIEKADELAAESWLLRKRAWRIYHSYYEPKRKPPTTDNSDLI